MGGNREDNRVERTPREEERKGKIRHEKRRGQERQGERRGEQAFSNWSRAASPSCRLFVPLPKLCLSKRDRGMAPVHGLKARSPLSTGRIIQPGLWLSGSETPLPFFFHFASALVPCDPSWHYKEMNPPSTTCAHFPAESGNGTRQTDLEMNLVKAAIRGFICSFVLLG